MEIAKKAEKKVCKHSIGGHLAISVANVLLAASGPLTIRKIIEELEPHGYYHVNRESVATALNDIACDQYRILTVTPVRAGDGRARAYSLLPK